MVEFFKKLFRSHHHTDHALTCDKNGQPLSQGMQMATAALLIQAAVSNGEVPETQINVLREELLDQFGIDEKTVSNIIDAAATTLKHDVALDALAEGVKECFDLRQRTLILAMAWKVVLCDGILDKFEKKTIASIQFKLGLDNDDSDEARIMAESGRV